ncbi:O-antigen ligase domain-containing protein [Corynebacterium nasicanis]|uniref:O-antigen ligase domain-containing protein n=1 Tax=Corynebacterium nasicanis TaxID=1448267 RepID=A0ABW1QFV5_9CORY
MTARLAAPVLLPFAAYVLWWVLGIGDFVWIIAGAVILAMWVGARGVRIPPVFLWWFLFVAWVAVTLVMNDSAGRFIGAVYRLLLYISAGLLALHTYHARHSLTVWNVTRAMVWFLAGMSAVGYLALAFPQAVIRTPASWVMPASLARNELVEQMIIRRMTHWNPAAWIDQAVRPVAPFLYANTWGNVYSLVLPLVLLHLWLAWHTRARWPVVFVVLASVYPALSTLNRGMFIGLGVVLLWVALQAVRRGRVLTALGGLAVAAGAATAWLLSPLGSLLLARVDTTYSTVDRLALYRATVEAVWHSPVVGYGSPRPAEEPWLPSLGTQGQLWTVLYSHGVVGAALFLGFLLGAFLLMVQRRDVVGSVLGGIVLATVVETIFYGMMTGIMVSFVVIALGLRPDTALSSGDRPGTGARRASTGPRPMRRWPA